MPNTGADLSPDPQASAVLGQRWLHVVAAVIRGADKCVLLARRPVHKHQGGKWEFPGGKVEQGEPAPVALARELLEELGILANPASMRPFVEVRHSYPDKHIWLDVWEITDFSGIPHGCEGQEVAWFSLDDLAVLEFPAANTPILAALKQSS